VQKVVPDDQLLDEALNIAEAICRGGKNAVPMIKEVATKGLGLPIAEALWLEQVYFQRNREEAIDEIEERLRAFQDRSKKGKK
jgi:enoyl-CoA hydratase/carnithine racemase